MQAVGVRHPPVLVSRSGLTQLGRGPGAIFLLKRGVVSTLWSSLEESMLHTKMADLLKSFPTKVLLILNEKMIFLHKEHQHGGGVCGISQTFMCADLIA